MNGGVIGMALPSVHLMEIPEDGLSITNDVQADEIGLASEDATVVGPLSLSADIMMAGRNIDVRGRLGGTFRRQCVRCLSDYEESAEVPFAGVYACEAAPRRSLQSFPGAGRKQGDGGTGEQD